MSIKWCHAQTITCWTCTRRTDIDELRRFKRCPVCGRTSFSVGTLERFTTPERIFYGYPKLEFHMFGKQKEQSNAG